MSLLTNRSAVAPQTMKMPGTVPTRRASVISRASPASYFVVKNVFKVKADSYSDFEEVWRSRESHLKEMPGFIQFAILKSTNSPGKYVSETHWETKDAFEGWAKSSQFKASHGGGSSGDSGEAKPQRSTTMSMLEGPPSLELYETVTTTSMN